MKCDELTVQETEIISWHWIRTTLGKRYSGCIEHSLVSFDSEGFEWYIISWEKSNQKSKKILDLLQIVEGKKKV